MRTGLKQTPPDLRTQRPQPTAARIRAIGLGGTVAAGLVIATAATSPTYQRRCTVESRVKSRLAT